MMKKNVDDEKKMEKIDKEKNRVNQCDSDHMLKILNFVISAPSQESVKAAKLVELKKKLNGQVLKVVTMEVCENSSFFS